MEDLDRGYIPVFWKEATRLLINKAYTYAFEAKDATLNRVILEEGLSRMNMWHMLLYIFCRASKQPTSRGLGIDVGLVTIKY